MLPSAVYNLFESQYGISVSKLNENIEAIPQISEKKHEINPPSNEIVGRGYVSFGRGTNAKKADKRNQTILKSW